ncbi:nucleoside monophosphate kinase [Candidatus Gottesmanbacteria bacterium]|nr:nucleoside monophosphate kinase [Candidatus Gottesmanbacteria bacterium]
MHIVFYGPEGSGKGTQAKLLATKIHLPILTSGDLVRDAAATDDGVIGDTCRAALSGGRYVADSEMFVLWKRRLKEQDAAHGWIMDGFPRNIDQAKFLDEKTKKYGYQVDRVIYLKLSQEESIRRLAARARPLHAGSTELHDSPDRIQKRLAVYRENETRVLAYYRKQGILVEINGEQSSQQVHEDILASIKHE